MLHSESGEDKLVEIVSHASRLLVKEVEIQRCLLKDDPLACHIYRQEVRIADLLEEVKSLFSRNPLQRTVIC